MEAGLRYRRGDYLVLHAHMCRPADTGAAVVQQRKSNNPALNYASHAGRHESLSPLFPARGRQRRSFR
jgi:hypothetical protein